MRTCSVCKPVYVVCKHGCHVQLTNDLNGDGGFVFKAVHFNSHLVNTRVVPLRCADKQDAVLVRVPDVDPLCVQRLTILQPGHHRLGLALRTKVRHKKIQAEV